MFKEKFTQEELNEARQNGFILTGKTGTGKSTLLNVIFGQQVAEAKKSAFAVTKKTQVYYLRLKNGKCVSIVDTPGLSDPDIISDNKADLDNIHLKEIEKKISEEKIHIKGILFLVNFQLERFDNSEQEALINYNTIFPLRRFWKHLIVIFTHDYADPNGDTTEEMRQSRDESNGIIFSKLMERVKDVSDVISYKELRIKYYNSYSPVKNNKQKQQNEKNKEDIEKLLDELSLKEPLFCQIEIKHVKNEKIKENGITYLVEYEKIGYFDLNNLPIKEQINIIKKEPINEPPPPPSCDYSGWGGGKTNDDKIKFEPIPQDELKYPKYEAMGAGIGAVGGGALGALGGWAFAGAAVTASAIAAPAAVCAGIGALVGFGISKLFN